MGKMWDGKLPLWQMFWIWFLIVPAIIRAVLFVTGIVTIANNDNSTGHDFLVISLLGALMLAYYIFVFVGTWRSASRYSESKSGIFGKNGFDWGVAAKLAMIVLFITSGLTWL